MRLEPRDEERCDHPDQSCVATELTQDDIQGADGPLGQGVVAPLEERDEEGVGRVAAQRNRRRVRLLRVVRCEHVRKAEELDAILIEPEVVEDGQCLLLNPIEGVQWPVIVI